MLETAYSKAIIVFLLIIIVKFYKKMISQVTKPKNSDDNKQERSILSQILTMPNLLTLSRIFCIPFILYYLLVDKHLYACLLFIYAAISDFLDGYIARKCKNQSSFLGSILDPLADKLLIGSLTITLTLNHMIPLALMVLIVGRDVTLIVVSLFVRYTVLEKPVTFWKYVNLFGYARIRVKAHWISKLNTVIQLVLITITLPSCLFNYQDSILLLLVQILTGVTTILSSIAYLVYRNGYELINDKSF